MTHQDFSLYTSGDTSVRSYDGSWTEWGNALRVPITIGPEQEHS